MNEELDINNLMNEIDELNHVNSCLEDEIQHLIYHNNNYESEIRFLVQMLNDVQLESYEKFMKNKI